MPVAVARPTLELATPWSRQAALLRRVMSSERSFGLDLLRVVLRAASWGYGLGVRVRNRAFDLGIKRSHRLAVPVISIGNLTAGGTGKTPIVVRLAALAGARGLRPAILTRGYRRAGSTNLGSDEAALLERNLVGVPVIVDPDRVAGGRRAIAGGADLLILDDGFQHRRLARTQDVVLLDAREPFGGDALLPRGLLREPVSGLERAHAVIVTRADRIDPAQREVLRARLAALLPAGTPIAFERHAPRDLVDLADGSAHELQLLRGARVVAFSGIGDPRTLSETLGASGAEVVTALDFGDHHEFARGDIQRIDAAVARHPGALAITTEKDAMRLHEIRPTARTLALRIHAAGIEAGAATGFETLLEDVLDRAGSIR